MFLATPKITPSAREAKPERVPGNTGFLTAIATATTIASANRRMGRERSAVAKAPAMAGLPSPCS